MFFPFETFDSPEAVCVHMLRICPLYGEASLINLTQAFIGILCMESLYSLFFNHDIIVVLSDY